MGVNNTKFPLRLRVFHTLLIPVPPVSSPPPPSPLLCTLNRLLRVIGIGS